MNTHHGTKKIITDRAIQIAGAGPAGLAAAITLANEGHKVVVHEAKSEVGSRFQGDLQGIENWSSKTDVLDELKNSGITTEFEYYPSTQGSCFDAWDRVYKLSNTEPLYYLIERGPGSGTLDSALLYQAQSLGVEIRFGSRINQIEGKGIFAIGPKAADAIAVGYHFDTDMDNGFWVICDNNLAPKGYAYLLVMNGRGTVKSCMFTGFKQEQLYVQRTIKAFERLVGLQMKNPEPHGGTGNFFLPKKAYAGIHPIAGEQAGFQDTLWGFGIRIAIRSGVMAAKSLIGGVDYNIVWKKEILPKMRTSIVNRMFYSLLGNRGYRWFLSHVQEQKDLRGLLHRQYNSSYLKNMIFPIANIYYQSKRFDKSCNHMGCHCVWCKCGSM